MIQKINSVTSAETKDDSSTIADVTTSSPNNAKPYVGRRLFVETHLEKLSKSANTDNSSCWYEAPYGELPLDLQNAFEEASEKDLYLKDFDFRQNPTFMSNIGFDYMAMFLWINCEYEIRKHLKSDRHTSTNDKSIASYQDFYSSIHNKGMGDEYCGSPQYCPITGSLLTRITLDSNNYHEELINNIENAEDLNYNTAYYILNNDLLDYEELVNKLYIVFGGH